MEIYLNGGQYKARLHFSIDADFVEAMVDLKAKMFSGDSKAAALYVRHFIPAAPDLSKFGNSALASIIDQLIPIEFQILERHGLRDLHDELMEKRGFRPDMRATEARLAR